VRTTLGHSEPDWVPVDSGGLTVTDMHVTCVAALRNHYRLEVDPVKVSDPDQMLGEISEDLKRITCPSPRSRPH
jgi:hypothetical protein